MKKRKRNQSLYKVVDPVENKAKGLAKQILGKDFKKLFKRGYLAYTIKIKNKFTRKKIIKRIYLVNNFNLYQRLGYNKFRRICSVLINYEQNVSWGVNMREDSVYTRLNRYDTLIAHYLWLKHYSKHPISGVEFTEKFNLLQYDDISLKDLINGIRD